MKLDRNLQKKILEFLRNYYPSEIEIKAFYNQKDSFIQNEIENKLYFNMFYLKEHGLITLTTGEYRINIPSEIYTAQITAIGLDFLEDDGGLGAILKTLTIKFNPDDIRKLLSEKIMKSDITPTIKDKIIKSIKNSPADILKILYTHLVDLALDKVPNVYHLIQTSLDQSS